MTLRKKSSYIAGFVVVILVAGLGSAIFAAFIGLVGIEARTKGAIGAYQDGMGAGRAAACVDLNNQMHWVINTENDLVRVGKETPATAAKLKAEALASYHYTCDRRTAIAPNLYDPSAQAPILPTGPISMPTGNHASVAEILLRGKPSPKPKPSPRPSPSPNQGD